MHNAVGCVQIAHLQDALNELRQSMKVSADDFESQRKITEAEAEARAQADRALLQVHHLPMSRTSYLPTMQLYFCMCYWCCSKQQRSSNTLTCDIATVGDED